jgi:hypothetical protein
MIGKAGTEMIVWFRNLPQPKLDLTEWKPFIQNTWFRKHYMKFVYLLMAIFLLAPNWFEAGYNFMTGFSIILIVCSVFVLHEVLHILVIYKKGDMSLTFKGIHFWLNTNAILSKKRFWIFMSLPFIVLTIIPAITSFFVWGDIKSLMLFIQF